MNFALERYKEQIIFNEAFRNSLGEELISNHSSGGTILLVANEIVFDPGFNFSYLALKSGHGWPGRHNMIIVADRIDSRGGTIDLGWHRRGSDAVGVPPKAGKGDPASKKGNDIEGPGRGNTGHTGNTGGPASNGLDIKVFCEHLVSDIRISSKGGLGGRGGQGGQGGDGGAGGQFSVLNENPPPHFISASVGVGRAGKGGTGGTGGIGGNGGKIELLYCNPENPTIHLDSIGGTGGEGGPGGPAGGGLQPLEVGEKGARGADGSPSTRDVKKVGSTELWERVSIELGLTS